MMELSSTEKCGPPTIASLNPHLVCALCAGYYIDPFTIIECLHSFCKTCIIKHLEASRYCPLCDVLVHKTKPLEYIRPDRTLQDLVYKLVPTLLAKEMERRKLFYADKRLLITRAEDKLMLEESLSLSKQTCSDLVPESMPNGTDRKVAVCLQMSVDGRPVVKSKKHNGQSSSVQRSEAFSSKRYLLCPSGFPVKSLRKFIRQKYDVKDDAFGIKIFHTADMLHDDYTVADIVTIYNCRSGSPLKLFFSITVPAKDLEPAPGIKAESTADSVIDARNHSTKSSGENNTLSSNNVLAVDTRCAADNEVTTCQDEPPQTVSRIVIQSPKTDSLQAQSTSNVQSTSVGAKVAENGNKLRVSLQCLDQSPCHSSESQESHESPKPDSGADCQSTNCVKSGALKEATECGDAGIKTAPAVPSQSQEAEKLDSVSSSKVPGRFSHSYLQVNSNAKRMKVASNLTNLPCSLTSKLPRYHADQVHCRTNIVPSSCFTGSYDFEQPIDLSAKSPR